MKILVTGGAGYIGSILIPQLLAAGHQVTILDTFSWGIRPILHFAADPRLEIISGDIRDPRAVRDALRSQDMVLHLAAIVGYPACAANPDSARSTNVGGTRELVAALEGRQIVFASTGSTYGKVEGICTEDTPIDPLTLYGSTKWEAERMVVEAGGVALRFATVFGVAPRLRLDLLINDFVYQALHARQIVLYEGHFRRTFLHVADAARSYLIAIERYSDMAGQAFNVGDEALNFTKREIAAKVREYVEFYLHEAAVGTDPDKRDYAVSYQKFQALGFRAEVSLDQGIRELIKVLRHLKMTNNWRNA